MLSYPAITLCNEAAISEQSQLLMNDSFLLENMSVPFQLLFKTVSKG